MMRKIGMAAVIGFLVYPNKSCAGICSRMLEKVIGYDRILGHVTAFRPGHGLVIRERAFTNIARYQQGLLSPTFIDEVGGELRSFAKEWGKYKSRNNRIRVSFSKKRVRELYNYILLEEYFKGDSKYADLKKKALKISPHLSEPNKFPSQREVLKLFKDHPELKLVLKQITLELEIQQIFWDFVSGRYAYQFLEKALSGKWKWLYQFLIDERAYKVHIPELLGIVYDKEMKNVYLRDQQIRLGITFQASKSELESIPLVVDAQNANANATNDPKIWESKLSELIPLQSLHGTPLLMTLARLKGYPKFREFWDQIYSLAKNVPSLRSSFDEAHRLSEDFHHLGLRQEVSMFGKMLRAGFYYGIPYGGFKLYQYLRADDLELREGDGKSGEVMEFEPDDFKNGYLQLERELQELELLYESMLKAKTG